MLHLDCIKLTALHLCYNLTAWNWQIFTCATTWLHETDSSLHVLQLDCLELTALHLCFSMRLTTGKISQATGNFRSFLLILRSHHYTDHYVTFRLVHFCTSEEPKELKKSLVVILRQPGDQPTHASHFRWITVKQARPHSLYATLKIVYIRWTNQTSDSKLLSF